MVKALPVPPVGTRFGRHVVIEIGVRMPPSARQERAGKDGPRGARMLCDCGSEKLVALSSLRRGVSTSCGCLKREQTRGLWRDPEFRAASIARGRQIMAKKWQDPAFAAEVSERSRKTNQALWKSPGFREAVIERGRARFTIHGLSGHPLNATYRGMMARCYRTTARGYHNYGGRGIRAFSPWHDMATALAWFDQHLGPRPIGMTLDRIDNDGHYVPGNVKWSSRRSQRLNTGHGTVRPITPPRCHIATCMCGGV